MIEYQINSNYVSGILNVDSKVECQLNEIAKTLIPNSSENYYIKEMYLNQAVDKCLKTHLYPTVTNDLKVYKEYIPVILQSLKDEFPDLSEQEALQIYLNRKNAKA